MSDDTTPDEITKSPDESADTARRLARQRRMAVGIAFLVKMIFATLRLKLENMEGLVPGGRGAILVTWHGRTLIPAALLRNRSYWALVSLSRDGDLQTEIFQRFGYQIVRGSTGRGGVRGALQMARKVREGGVLSFTPDGPRGPSHKVQAGVILMAQKSGAPIIPVGISASWRYLVRSWDSYMVPLPFARAWFIVGEPIFVPADLTEGEREAIATRLELAVNCVEREAERRCGHLDYQWRTE